MEKNIVQKMQSAYTHGRLITEDQWLYLSKIYRKVKEVERKEQYLTKELDSMKKASITELFLGADLEEFFVLTETSKVMFSILLDLEDYLDYRVDGEHETVFENDEEALKAVKNAFKKLEEIRFSVEEYLTNDFE